MTQTAPDKTVIAVIACIAIALVLAITGIGVFIVFGADHAASLVLINNSGQELRLVTQDNSVWSAPGEAREIGYPNTYVIGVQTPDGKQFRYRLPRLGEEVVVKGKIYLQIEPDNKISPIRPEGFPLLPLP